MQELVVKSYVLEWGNCYNRQLNDCFSPFVLPTNSSVSCINTLLFSSDRKKRKKSTAVEESSGTPRDVQKEIQTNQNESSQKHTLLLENSLVENGKPPNTNGELNHLSTPESDQRTNNINVTTPSEKR